MSIENEILNIKNRKNLSLKNQNRYIIYKLDFNLCF